MNKVKSVPDGYHTATPYLIVSEAAKALEFYHKAFGATEIMRLPGPDGKVGHAEIQIGDSRIMLADEFPAMGARSPRTLGGSPISIMLYVDDVDAMFAKAVELGATVKAPITNKFYGDRSGAIEDPFGHNWYISTHVEDIPEEELRKRAAELSNSGS